jgi:hypothetical protein
MLAKREKIHTHIHTADCGKGYNLTSTLLVVESIGIHPHVYIVD